MTTQTHTCRRCGESGAIELTSEQVAARKSIGLPETPPALFIVCDSCQQSAQRRGREVADVKDKEPWWKKS
jgi:hypothetical protein